jgi:hypothetical protein
VQRFNMENTLPTEQFGLMVETPHPIASGSRSYRPPSWPPSRDWICIEDKNGTPISRWGDPVWDISPWAGCTLVLNFGDGHKLKSNSAEIDRENADLFRLAMTWRIWGFRGIRSVRTIQKACSALRPIFVACSRNGILASDLSRYPKVLEELAGEITPSLFDSIINELNTLLNASKFLGFTILDAAGIAQLKASDPEFISNQTEYIPPRIYKYQIKRLKEFVDSNTKCNTV